MLSPGWSCLCGSQGCGDARWLGEGCGDARWRGRDRALHGAPAARGGSFSPRQAVSSLSRVQLLSLSVSVSDDPDVVCVVL